jgi:hypothetical protein
VLPRRERPCVAQPRRCPLAGKERRPAPASKIRKVRETAAPSSLAQRSGRTQIGVSGPAENENTDPPRAPTRASSSKNGIMFASVDEVEEPRPERQLRPSAARSGLARRAPGASCAGLVHHPSARSTPTTSASGKRRRDEGGEPGAGTEVEHAARRAARRLERASRARRTPSVAASVPVGARVSNCRASASGSRQSRGADRRRSSSAGRTAGRAFSRSARLTASAGGSDLVGPRPTPNISAALPPLIAIATFPYASS